MNKRHAIIFALLCAGLLASSITLFTIKEERERITIERVLDGDTLKTTDGETMRLVNINAPEKDSPLALQATALVKSYEHKQVFVERLGQDKYHRTLARIYTPAYLNIQLVQRGLVSIFLVQEDELTAFSHAEDTAIVEQQGIWQKDEVAGCISLRVNAKEEYVTIINACAPQNTAGWYLKDESRKIYKLPAHMNHELVVRSDAGKDNETTVFWNAGSVWNNDRDTAYLFSNDNQLISYVRYGY